jgi:hypothetical protein
MMTSTKTPAALVLAMVMMAALWLPTLAIPAAHASTTGAPAAVMIQALA